MSDDAKVLTTLPMVVDSVAGNSLTLSQMTESGSRDVTLLMPEFTPQWAPRAGDILDVVVTSRRGTDLQKTAP